MAGADTRPADHQTRGLIMTKKEKELENKGYVYWRTCDTPQQAKERAANLRCYGFRATVYTVTRNGVPYYLIYAKPKEK